MSYLHRRTESFNQEDLLDDLVGILSGNGYPIFPNTCRSSPSPEVVIHPSYRKWDGLFWKEKVVPAMSLLESGGIPMGGWGSPAGRSRIRSVMSGA